MQKFDYIELKIEESVAVVTLSNTKKTNALNEKMWQEIGDVFDLLSEQKDAHVAIIQSSARHFSSGIDINFILDIIKRLKAGPEDQIPEALYQQLKTMQKSISCVQKCRIPVIAAVHGVCVGAALDLIAACDIRVSTYSAMFSILETKLGIVADMGTLQRLPKIISDSHLKQLALSSEFFSGLKAKKINLVNANYLTKKSLQRAAKKLAKKIAVLPPHAVQGTKETINFARDNSIEQGLEQVAKLNSTLLLSEQTLFALDKVKSRLGSSRK